MCPMRIVSANVNGIRAAVRREGVTWLADRSPQVLALQETRASQAQLRAALAGSAFAEWELALEAGAQAGRAGVALLTPRAVVDTRGAEALQLPGIADGRWVEADLDHHGAQVTLISAYIHTGSVGMPIQNEKYAMLDAVTARLDDLRDQGRHVVLTGDLNICHTERDLKNWKGNIGKAGFLPAEREYLNRWFESGWVDLGRRTGGEGDGPYTWWSWRGKAFDNDAGWRIDYQIASPALAAAAGPVRVGRAPSYAQRWSDHAAVEVDYGQLHGSAWLDSGE